MDSRIHSITAREILDSRGNPTVETTVILQSGYRGTASSPAGASVGKYEAVEIRDKDEKRYSGMGVLTAVSNVNTVIAPKLHGMDALDQAAVDRTIIELDGTPNKAKLGANSVLSVSLAISNAAASNQQLPLYRYLNSLFHTLIPTSLDRMPTPTFNLINGGAHGAGNLDFQEFHIIPATNKSYHDALALGDDVYHKVKQILIYRNAVHSVGDEGGFAPNLFTNLDALEVLTEALKNTIYKPGLDVFLGLDVAASHFRTERGYQIKDRPMAYSVKEFIAYLRDLHAKYRLLILEDPFAEDEWESWTQLTREIGQDVLIVGDDLLATNPQRLTKAIEMKACSGLLAKPNQIGTLTEFLDVIADARKHDIKIVVSHRSGETNDTTIADLAVAVQSEYVKFGAPARGERIAKYNRLLAIESELFPQK